MNPDPLDVTEPEPFLDRHFHAMVCVECGAASIRAEYHHPRLTFLHQHVLLALGVGAALGFVAGWMAK